MFKLGDKVVVRFADSKGKSRFLGEVHTVSQVEDGGYRFIDTSTGFFVGYYPLWRGDELRLATPEDLIVDLRKEVKADYNELREMIRLKEEDIPKDYNLESKLMLWGFFFLIAGLTLGVILS